MGTVEGWPYPVTGSPGRGALFAAAATALLAALVLLVAPLYSSGRTLIDANGPGIAWVIAVPLILALLPLGVPARARFAATWAAATMLLLMCFFSSAGIFFLPAAILLVVAAYGFRAQPDL